jgi:hypothetical protein
MLIILELGIDDLTILNIQTSNQGINEIVDKNVDLA